MGPQHRRLSSNIHVISLALRGALVLGVQPGISLNIQPPHRLFAPAVGAMSPDLSLLAKQSCRDGLCSYPQPYMENIFC